MTEYPREPQPWPDMTKPGVPLNPERDGWHWLETAEGHLLPYNWCPAGECERGRWPARWLFDIEAEIDPRTCRYLGPCLTPAEVAAQVAAAAQAMREAAKAKAREMFPWQGSDYYCDSCKNGIVHPGGEELADAIAALPIEHGDALAAAPALATLRRLYHQAQNGGTVTAGDLSRVIAMMERARGEGGGNAG